MNRTKFERYSIDTARKLVKSFGYDLLSTEYKKSTDRYRFRNSSTGVEFEMTLRNFLKGYRGDRNPLPIGIDEVKRRLALDGYTTVATTYNNNKEKLPVLCPLGHEIQISMQYWSQGIRCAICNGGVRKEHAEVELYLRTHGLTLKSEYLNSNADMLVACSNGHQFSRSWHTFKRGITCCPLCKQVIRAKELWSKIELEGFQPQLPFLIENYNSTIQIVCPKGHVFDSSLYQWGSGSRCKKCLLKEIDDFRELLDKENHPYKLIKVIKHKKLLIECQQGHKYFSTFDEFKNGKRCRRCKKPS